MSKICPSFCVFQRQNTPLQNWSWTWESTPGFISVPRRSANSKIIAKKYRWRLKWLGWMSLCGGKPGISSYRRWRSWDQCRGSQSLKCIRAQLQKNVCSYEGKMLHLISCTRRAAGRRAFVTNQGAMEEMWERTVVHFQMYSQLTGR